MRARAVIEGAEGADASESSVSGVRVSRIVVGYSAFLALLIPFFLWAGRGEWFLYDDWDYLVSRKAGNFADLTRPHNGHFEAIPVLVYRALFSTFGLRYKPYQLVAIVLSLAGAVLLLVVMLRARTRPWLAIMLATLLVLFGDAQTNVALRITSITFVGFAVPLGLAQLLLADHEGPIDRRDWFGLAAGLAAILCSSVAVPMVLVVGVAMLVKRGWRVALLHALPPAIAFSVSYAAVGHDDVGAGHPTQFRPLPQALHFALVLAEGTFEAITRTHGIGGVLIALLLLGLYLVVRRAGPERRRQAVVPCAMVVGAFFFAVETGVGRAYLLRQGARAVRGGHYMDVVAYLVLPAVAFVAEEIIRRWRVIAPVLAVLLLIAIPANAHALVTIENDQASTLARFRGTILLIPQLPVAEEVPRTEHPFLTVAGPVTIGWLLDTAREGKMPRRHYVTAEERAVATLQISLVLTGNPPTPCRALRAPVTRRIPHGAAVRFRGAEIRVGYLSGGTAIGHVYFRTSSGLAEWQLVNVGRPLTARVAPGRIKVPVTMLCK